VRPEGESALILKLMLAFGLMAGCVAIHAVGVSAALRWLRLHSQSGSRFWQETRLFIELAAWMILLHMSEIAVWAVVYAAADVMPGLQSAFYFSTVTYTTTGYGDLVLPEDWRLLGGVEALTGILMCGWSTGFFFAVVSRLYLARARPEQ
jgi:voltage-gated potassium channel Kch